MVMAESEAMQCGQPGLLGLGLSLVKTLGHGDYKSSRSPKEASVTVVPQ